jgi:hypothetical protein
MSERERWIVYPLLFLALGAALRDKLFDMTTSKRIICQELIVVDEDSLGVQSPRPLARIGRIENPAHGSTTTGFLFVDGQVEVAGPVIARQFAIGGLPYAPGILGVLPPELWRALQQSAQGWQKSIPSQPSPPNAKPQDADNIQTKSPADGSKSATEESAESASQ